MSAAELRRLVPGDATACDKYAVHLQKLAEGASKAQEEWQSALRAIEDWRGPTGDSARAYLTQEIKAVDELRSQLQLGSRTYSTLSDNLAAAQRMAIPCLDIADTLGMDAVDLADRDWIDHAQLALKGGVFRELSNEEVDALVARFDNTLKKAREAAAEARRAAEKALRPDRDEIMRHYQVKDEKLKPMGGPWKHIPGFGSDKPESEQKLLTDLSAKDKAMWMLTANQAWQACRERYPVNEQADGHVEGELEGHADAFRHAYWNALMVKRFGPEQAEKMATYHEYTPEAPDKPNAPTSEAMDLHNNQLGRNIAKANPNASEEELADLIAAAVKEGQTLVMDSDGKLIHSDRVQPGQTYEPEKKGGSSYYVPGYSE